MYYYGYWSCWSIIRFTSTQLLQYTQEEKESWIRALLDIIPPKVLEVTAHAENEVLGLRLHRAREDGFWSNLVNIEIIPDHYKFKWYF